MKINLGKTPLSREQMKAIQGGKLFGCAMQGQAGVAYVMGCCTGLTACGGTNGNLCEPTLQCD